MNTHNLQELSKHFQEQSDRQGSLQSFPVNCTYAYLGIRLSYNSCYLRQELAQVNTLNLFSLLRAWDTVI
uniref:Uncharacterized protein n=1 Tax=Helianthus annuus TaxID=4232 RepID=A0A1Y3BUI5_HELAN